MKRKEFKARRQTVEGMTLFFPCDPGCESVTFRGIMHSVIAIPYGFMMLFSILAFSRRLTQDEQWTGYERYSLITFIVGFSLGIVTAIFAKSQLGGLLERLVSAAYQQWYVVGISLTRRKS